MSSTNNKSKETNNTMKSTHKQKNSIDSINESSSSSYNPTLQDIAIGINRIENILLDFTKQMSLLNENISQIITNQPPSPHQRQSLSLPVTTLSSSSSSKQQNGNKDKLLQV